VRQAFSERQVFRIDHYLGKPAVQNLFALRFGNALFEPLWRREPLPTSRSRLPRTWAWKSAAPSTTHRRLRDMVQNHALQLLCAIGMEPPINAHADAIRDEKLKVLRSLKPWTPETMASMTVRGQYAAGNMNGTAVRPTATSRVWTRTATPRPSWRCAPRSPTGAGPACRFTSAPASGWPGATPASW
jgi:glucose-6-phosphate 1-dehydrogenase